MIRPRRLGRHPPWRGVLDWALVQDDRLAGPIPPHAQSAGPFRQSLANLRQLRFWSILVAFAIIANSVTLGLLTTTLPTGPVRLALEQIDEITIVLLVADVVLTIFVKRIDAFRNGWDLFEIAVTVVSIVPALQVFAAFRAFRTVRLLRLLSFLPSGRETIDGLFKSMRRMTTTLIIVMVVFYIYAILCTTLFRDIDPAHFGDIAETIISLYEIMVYYGADKEVMGTVTRVEPWSWLIFGPFTFLTSFALMNMFIGVVTTAMEEEVNGVDDESHETILRLESKLDALVTRLDTMMQFEAGTTHDARLCPERPLAPV